MRELYFELYAGEKLSCIEVKGYARLTQLVHGCQDLNPGLHNMLRVGRGEREERFSMWSACS